QPATRPAPARPPAAVAAPAAPPRIPYPDWLFPTEPELLKPPPGNPPKEPPKETKLDDQELLTIPDSDQKFTLARINDYFNAPDWFPAQHIAMPEVVAQGNKARKMIACAYCHTPTGAGRPEHAALA